MTEPRVLVTGSTKTYSDNERTYYACEYIESTGTQYVSLGQVDYRNTDEFTFRLNYTTGGSLQFVFAQNPTSGRNNIGLFLNGSNQIVSQMGTSRMSQALTLNEWHDISLTQTAMTVDGTEYAYSSVTDEFTVSGLLSVLTTTADTRGFKGQISSFTWTRAGETLRDLRPCYYLDSDTRVYGMFDIVSSTFYGNAGTGAFTGGEAESTTEYRVLVTSTQSKNLLRLADREDRTVNGVTYGVTDGILHLKGACTGTMNILLDMTAPYTGTDELTVTYTGTGLSTSSYVYCALRQSTNTTVTGTNGNCFGTLTKTFTPSVDVSKLLVQCQNGSTLDTTLTVMLNEGSTALPYEPYGSETVYRLIYA